jgi:hypothetical protein
VDFYFRMDIRRSRDGCSPKGDIMKRLEAQGSGHKVKETRKRQYSFLPCALRPAL